MLNLKREIFAATERTFRFAGLNASFENARTFRFADYSEVAGQHGSEVHLLPFLGITINDMI